LAEESRSNSPRPGTISVSTSTVHPTVPNARRRKSEQWDGGAQLLLDKAEKYGFA
jgi:hypothetical protein